jgi:alpha-D-xyloside xylohydrolase
MPYIYSLAGKVYLEDYTIMRPLVMDFPTDPHVTGISDQYMFGPSLMISPVYGYKWRERTVWFPGSQGWYDLESGEFISGMQELSVAAPYEKIPVYVRAGSILPFGPEIQYVGEKPDAPLLLQVYEGADGAFTLYEDDGLSNDYENGACSTITLSYNDQSKTLVIGERKGSFDGMAGNREFRVNYIKKENPRNLDLEATPDHTVGYTGSEISLQF